MQYPTPAQASDSHPGDATTPDHAAPVPIRLVPLAEIDAAALPRDREALEDEALAELRHSIAAGGLRMPVELWRLSEPRGAHRYGLISGLRRLSVFRSMHELTGESRWAAIPALIRAPASYAAALSAMVEENEIRCQLSPWERGRIAWLAQRQEIFPTVEAAVLGLYPSAARQKRNRLHAVARLAEELDGFLTAPERLTERQCLRIESALRAGYGSIIRVALTESRSAEPETQWQLLLPILAEAESQPPEAPANPLAGGASPRSGRPRRMLKPRETLTIRREMTRDGWCLHFTGRHATSALLDDAFDEIERLLGPE